MAKQVTPDEAIKELAHDVIFRALDDLFFGGVVGTSMGKKRRQVRMIQNQLSAFQFLTSDEVQFWADIYGAEFDTNLIWQSPDIAKRAVLEYKKSK